MPLYRNDHVIHDNYSIHICLILPNDFTIKNFSEPGSVIMLMYRNENIINKLLFSQKTVGKVQL